MEYRSIHQTRDNEDWCERYKVVHHDYDGHPHLAK